MQSAFSWVGEFFQWIGKLIPRWRVVTEAQGGVAFVRGKAREVKPGMLFWWPAWTELHVQEVVRQTLNLPPQSLLTRDGKDVAVSGIVIYEISDPLTAFVKVHDLDEAIQDMALAGIKGVLWGLTLEEMYGHADEIDVSLCASCKEKLRDWGVRVHNVFLSDLSTALVVRHMGQGERGSFVPDARHHPDEELLSY